MEGKKSACTRTDVLLVWTAGPTQTDRRSGPADKNGRRLCRAQECTRSAQRESASQKEETPLETCALWTSGLRPWITFLPETSTPPPHVTHGKRRSSFESAQLRYVVCTLPRGRVADTALSVTLVTVEHEKDWGGNTRRKRGKRLYGGRGTSKRTGPAPGTTAEGPLYMLTPKRSVRTAGSPQ